MKILIAPLNWGLGHASRCVPLVRQALAEGHEVTLAGDGDSLLLLRRQFPELPYRTLAPLRLRYSEGSSQVAAIVRALPHLVRWAIRDHRMLRQLLRREAFDRVVSDNRFGCYSRRVESIYMTHQLHIFLPEGWRWLEPLASRVHARIIKRYSACWVPDYAELSRSLAGEMSHPQPLPQSLRSRVQYIGLLSRFADMPTDAAMGSAPDSHYDVVAVLSGLEPQRSLLEQQIATEWEGRPEQVLIVQGCVGAPRMRRRRGNITRVPYLEDQPLAAYLRHTDLIIARSGYSSIMDFEALGVLSRTELIPTPGQPEQQYLADRHSKNNKSN